MNAARTRRLAWVFLSSSFVFLIVLAVLFVITTNAFFLGMHDFVYYLHKSRTWTNLITTVWTASIATLLSMLIGIPAGYALSRFKFPCSVLTKTLVDLPVMIPPAAIGLFLLGMFKTPPVENITQFFGIKVVHALPGVIVAQFAVTASFCIRLVMASFENVHPGFEAVSRSLGASLPRTFFKISLPLAKNGILASLIVVWARAAAEWESLMLFVGGIQGRTDVMPFAVYLDWNGGMLGWALTTSILCVCIALLSMLAVSYIGKNSYVF